MTESESHKTCEICRESNRKYREAHKEERNKASREWRATNKERVSQLNKEYFKANKSRLNEYKKRRLQQNPELREQVKPYKHAWYMTNRERLSEKYREYHEKNRERDLAYLREYGRNRYNADPTERQRQRIKNHTRRAQIKHNGGSFTFKELNALFEAQEGFCFYCGELLYASFDKDIHIEHKIPLSRGGSNNIENIVLSCAPCNLSKGTKTHEEFLATKTEVERLKVMEAS
jgi:5-methylcytosine-specific restriction endonuclease McrA